jgi:hypothetical protein
MIRTHKLAQVLVSYHVVRRVLVAERPPAAAAVMLQQRKIRQKIRGMVFQPIYGAIRSSQTEKYLHGCERGVGAYAAAEGGEGAAADVAVGGLLERRRRLHGLLRRDWRRA